MKTCEETRHIMDGFTNLLPAFDGSTLSRKREGFRQALLDFCCENKLMDRYELATHHDEPFARGYEMGLKIAWTRFAELQPRKGFPGEPTFSSVALYGRAR